MTNILAYQAKRTLMDRIDTLLASDLVQVAYVFPGDPERLCVYGGAIRFVQADAVAEAGILSLETATIDVWVRAYLPGDDARAADALAEGLADQIIGDFNANPKLTGPLTIVGLANGDGGVPQVSAAPEPAVTVQLLLQFVVEGDV